MNLSSLFKFKRNVSNLDSDLKEILVEVESNLFSELDKENYSWPKSIHVKKYECLILSKFLMCYSISVAYIDLDKKVLNLFSKKIDDVFMKLHDEKYSEFLLYKDMQNVISKKCDLFNSLRKDNKPPECWHLIYSTLTGKKTIDEMKYDILGLKKAIATLEPKTGADNLVLKFKNSINQTINEIESFDLAEILFRQSVRLIKKQLISLDVPKQLSLKK